MVWARYCSDEFSETGLLVLLISLAASAIASALSRTRHQSNSEA